MPIKRPDITPSPPEPVAVRSKQIVTLFDGVVLNATTTEAVSDPLYCRNFRYFTLYLYVKSSGTPTNVQFQVQFGGKPGGRWHTFKQGLFASLFYEDQDTSGGLAECFLGDVAGRVFRLKVIGTGTDASNTFTVSAAVEFYA